MRLIIALLFVLGGFQFAQAQSSSTRVKTSAVKRSVLSAKPTYRFTTNFNNSRISGTFGSGDQNKLRKPGFELVRVFNMGGMAWESGLAYETLGGRLIDEDTSSSIEISYLTVPLLRRTQITRVGDFNVVAIWGGKLAIQSKAEAKDTDVVGTTAVSETSDLEEFIEEYDVRASVGINFESKSPKTLGFSTGLSWQRGTRNIVEGTGPKYITDTLAFNMGMLF